ncbi:unnamed protein product [Amoebophrya sp. A120]|nr:unnamed protein product [Amoebophrya sp. A120]|eukprot:GSA120T00002842001.1
MDAITDPAALVKDARRPLAEPSRPQQSDRKYEIFDTVAERECRPDLDKLDRIPGKSDAPCRGKQSCGAWDEMAYYTSAFGDKSAAPLRERQEACTTIAGENADAYDPNASATAYFWSRGRRGGGSCRTTFAEADQKSPKSKEKRVTGDQAQGLGAFLEESTCDREQDGRTDGRTLQLNLVYGRPLSHAAR